MFHAIDLSFFKGEVLTKVMLDELNQFPRSILAIEYHSFPEGILCGTDIYEKDRQIFMGEGLIKYKDSLFRMETPYCLSEFVQNCMAQGQCLPQNSYKIVLVSSTEVIDKRKGQVSTTLTPKLFLQSHNTPDAEGIPIAFFSPISGNVILPRFTPSLDQKEFRKFIKSGSFSMVAVPYSSQSGITFHPYIFSKIQEILQVKPDKSPLDYMILQEIIKNKMIEMGFIELLVKDFIGEQRWATLPEDTLARREEILLSFVQSLVQQPTSRPTATSEVKPRTERNNIGGRL